MPDETRLELDELLRQLTSRAHDVLATQTRLRGLLNANAAVASELSLHLVLRRIVEAAQELLNAKYVALGVLGADGQLEEFLHIGLNDELVAQIGHLPVGQGVLGLLITHPEPIRLADIAQHPASVGFPAHHPPMGAFLGVPVRVRDVVFGNLYVTEPRNRSEFTAEDEELAGALAATAGVAIENARLYAESEQRRAWLAASAELTRELLSGAHPDLAQVVVAAVRRSADADQAEFVPEDGVEPAASSVGGAGPLVEVPLRTEAHTLGRLRLSREPGRRPFTDLELDLLAGFATQAALALELAQARADQQELLRLEDHDRIARDLHDHVIQELFALGMGLEATIAAVGHPEPAGRLTAYMESVDSVIRRIRATIFQLQPAEHGQESIQAQLITIINEVTATLGFTVGIQFSGPLDIALDDALADDVIAVTREALTNCVRHAAASSIDVRFKLADGRISVEVADNGRGLGAATRSSGLANLRTRAARHGGELTLLAPAGGGTTLVWTAQLAVGAAR